MCIICFIQPLVKVQNNFFYVINHVQSIEMGNLFKVRFYFDIKKKNLYLEHLHQPSVLQKYFSHPCFSHIFSNHAHKTGIASR